MVEVWNVLRKAGTVLWVAGGFTYVLGLGAGFMGMNNKYEAQSHGDKVASTLNTIKLCRKYPKDIQCPPNLEQQLAFHQAREELHRRRFEKWETISGYTPFPYVNSGVGYVITTAATRLDNLLEPEKPTGTRNTF